MQKLHARNDEVLFVLSVDTEEEWDWSGKFPENNFSVANTGKIPRFQEFCNKLGVKPTYFVDHAIASDQASVEYLKDPLSKGQCEIASHLHPWCTPPFEEKVNPVNSHIVNLPISLVREKIKNITNKIQEQFAVSPMSFRSGRWGINGAILEILADHNYGIDSSVFPYYKDAYFSYEDALETPFWPDFSMCTRSGAQRQIFEIPVTSGFNRKNFSLWHAMHSTLSNGPWNKLRLISMLWHSRLLRKLQLSPELASSSQMVALVKACLQKGHKVIHMFFHSSSLLPGGSPYVSNEQDLEMFYQSIKEVVDYLTDNVNLQFCTLTEVRNHYLRE